MRLVLLIVMNIMMFGFFFITKKYIKNEGMKRLGKFSFITFLILSALELTVFNFRHYESLSYKQIVPPTYTLGSGLEVLEDGYIKVINTYDNYIEFDNINTHLNNIYINLGSNEESNNVVAIQIGYTDEANHEYAYTESRYINNVTTPEIMRLHLAGKTEKIRVKVETLTDVDTFKINRISFNRQVPMQISVIRATFILCIAMLIFVFRPKSSLYEMKYSDKKAKGYIIFALSIQLLVLAVSTQLMPYFGQEKFDIAQRRQYQLLAESFMKGHTYLDVEPGPVLKSLDNPYDKFYREKVLNENNEKYIWDAAFYNNRYYVYFGVAPVILYYLPFYALTGHHLMTSMTILMTAILSVIGLFKLFKKVCDRWFPNVKLGHFLMLLLVTINGCGILTITSKPDHYSLPILMGVMFSIWGLFFYLKATEKDKLSKRYLLLGSICMASIAACRPQMLLSCFFAIPIFIDYIKKRKFVSKKTWKETLCFAIPFIVIAALLMYYNYVRFGSPFDFGANYNLTTNDMTRRGFVLDRIPLGLFEFLFKPLNLSLNFPFVIRTLFTTSYMGTTISEPMAGGFFALNLITLFSFYAFKLRKNEKDKLPYTLAILCLVFTLLIVIADTEMAGILPRYFCDFGFYLYFATSIVLFNLLNKEKDNHSLLCKIVIAAFIIAFVCNVFFLLSDTVFIRSRGFFYLRRLFEFWM